MFIPWRFELKNIKKEGNVLLIHVKAHSRMVADKADEAQEKLVALTPAAWIRERSLVRRYQRSYAEDYAGVGQAFWGIGIVRPVQVLGFASAFIEETEFVVESMDLADCKWATANLSITVNSNANEASYGLKAILVDKFGGVAAESEFASSNGKAAAKLRIDSPLLWQPLGYGEPNLYTLRVVLSDNGNVLHSIEKQVGLKQIELLRKTETGRFDFRFVVNGKPIYAKGSNWIPIDALNAGGTYEQTENLIKLAANAGMNMMRIWGGGMLEPDWFYSLFDKYGIMVWEDAFLHSHPYPDYDDEFNEQVSKETIIAIKQLRNHPCFAVFCGGNELQEGWDAWGWKMTQDRFYGEKLIYGILPKICAKHCPEIPYVPNSPHGEKLSQSPVDGETHTWGNFYNATEDPLFVTETCWHSGTISRPKTLEQWMGINADDYEGKGWNLRWAELTKQANLWQVNQFTEYHLNSSLREYARGLEIEQMTADYMSLYYVRTRGPSCTGILYWPFNKGGPMMNYGCIDYSQNPLMPYYLCVRLFKPIVMHAYRDSSDIRVRVTNDGEPFDAKLTITLFDTVTGGILETEEKTLSIPSGSAHLAYTQGTWYKSLTNRWRQAAHVQLAKNGHIISEDFLLFCPLFELETDNPSIIINAYKVNGKEWDLTISSDKFIKHLALECDTQVMFSDNYFMLRPGVAKSVHLTVLGNLSGKICLTPRALDYDESSAIELV
jgi:beta-mannosidase